MSKVIVHIDLNMFFVRCEEIKDPTLIGKPVAIGGEGRCGIISTCSYEARKFGVHSGQPTFEAKKLCKHLILKPVDYRFYSVLSSQFMKFVRQHTEIVEQMSIDECFCDFTDALKGVKDPMAYFKKFQDELYQKTQLMCSIGIATTKFLAKMASDMKKPMGITVLRKRDLPEKLYPLPIGDMFGIGKKTAPRFIAMGINTIGDLKQRMDETPEQMKSYMGKSYDTFKAWINGEGNDVVETEREDVKSIGHSSTFRHDTDNLEEVKEMFKWLSDGVSRRAIEQRKMGTTIQIVIKTTEFKSYNKSLTLEAPTNKAKVIYNTAVKLYEQNFKGILIRLAGVTLQNLIDPSEMAIQMSLFDYEKHEEENSTRLLINDINRKLNKNVLMRASELESKPKKIKKEKK